MSKRLTSSSGVVSTAPAPSSANGGAIVDDHDGPFLPLEESGASSHLRERSGTETSIESVDMTSDDDDTKKKMRKNKKSKSGSSTTSSNITAMISKVVSYIQQGIPSRLMNKNVKIDGKQVVLFCMIMIFVLLIWDTMIRDPEHRFLKPDFSNKFLAWVQTNPALGLGAILLVIAGAVVTMVPIGTPLVVGCGYIYRGVYGWGMGLFVATVVAMAGSTLGAVTCFLLGRYLMRERVQKWVRKYPLFDAINVAAKEHGLRIMAMLYLTPVLPLGLISYMCGTTSMSIYSFTVAKIASLPLYLIYTFMGASAHSFIKHGGGKTGVSGDGAAGGEQQADQPVPFSAEEEARQLEENEALIVAGILLSVIMMTLITRHIKKELMKILEEQKRNKPGEARDVGDESGDDDGEENVVEMGYTTRRHRRPKTADHIES